MHEPSDNPAARPLAPTPATDLLRELFDASFYLSQLAVIESTVVAAPEKHYLEIGWRQGLNPHPFFDARWYLEQNPDVATAKAEPFGHYLAHGWKEGRLPHPRFNGVRYLARHPTLLRSETFPRTLLERPSGLDDSPSTKSMGPADWPSHYQQGRSYPYADPQVMAGRIARYRATRHARNKIVVFTCIVGGYDSLRLPEQLAPDIDYVVFTDIPMEGHGVFQVRPIEHPQEDAGLTTRYIKLHPHDYFADYDIAVWCDANVLLRQDLRARLDLFAASDLPLAFVPHPFRNCLYQEAVVCVQMTKVRADRIIPQILGYQREGYPENHGLIEGNLFACRPQRPETRAFFDAWWDQFVQGGRRDQLSANYVLWKQNLTYFPLLGEGLNTRNYPGTALLDHGTHDAGYFAALAPARLKAPLFHVDTPDTGTAPVVYSPLLVSGWFVDTRLNGAARIRVRLGALTAICDRVFRPDVAGQFKSSEPPLGAVGFSAQIPAPRGRHHLVIEAETLSGEIVPLKTRRITVQTWPPRRAGLLDRLADLRRRWTWRRHPDPSDSVLVLIPVKPGSPPAASARARALAERALQGLPAGSRVVLDERGIPAASRNEHPWRIAALAAIRQGMIDHHLRDERWVFWADLDIADYPADLIATLIRRAEGGVAAPFVLMANTLSPRGGPRFFDLAGFVEEGRWATIHPPFFRQPGPVHDLDSVGCCYLISADLYRRGARHEEDPGSRRWIETHGASAADTPRRDWTDLAYTDHYSVCAFARRHGLPVRAFADLIALHEHLS